MKLERNSSSFPTIQKEPMSQPTPDKPDSPALTRLSPRKSTQNTLARVTALWPLKREPQIPMSTRPEPDTTFTAQEESGLACLHTRRDLTPLWKLHRNPKIHVSTGEKSYVLTSKVTEAIGPCADWRGIPRGPSQLAWRLDFPEET